jgi:thioredoxin 1
MALEFNDQNFDQEVLQSEQPVLVDFWAPWCGPCKIMGPVIDDLAKKIAEKGKVGKLNVEENHQTASRYNIMSIPTIKIFKNGKVVSEFVGVQNMEILAKEMETAAE